jgi:hypothetical protein
MNMRKTAERQFLRIFARKRPHFLIGPSCCSRDDFEVRIKQVADLAVANCIDAQAILGVFLLSFVSRAKRDRAVDVNGKQRRAEKKQGQYGLSHFRSFVISITV